MDNTKKIVKAVYFIGPYSDRDPEDPCCAADIARVEVGYAHEPEDHLEHTYEVMIATPLYIAREVERKGSFTPEASLLVLPRIGADLVNHVTEHLSTIERIGRIVD